MALTKVGPAGIGSTPGNGFTIGNSFLHATGLDSTNAKFTGIVTAQTFRVLGDFQVDGTTTTLDTAVTEVDRLEVNANNTTVAVAVTQSGSGDAAIFMGGNVGIGTDNPTTSLQINHASPKIILEDNDNGADISIHNVGGSSVYSAASDIVLQTSNTSERLRITSGGDVGIGYNTPTVKLHIREAASGVSSYDNRYHCIIEDDSEAYYGVYVPNSGYGGLRVVDGSGNIGSRLDYYVNENQMHYQCVGDHIFSTSNNAERFRITDAGKIGIGTATPNWLTTIQGGSGGAQTTLLNLHVPATDNNTGSILRFSNSNSVASTYGTAEIRALRTAYNTGYTDLIFTTSDGNAVTEKVRIKGGTGNVGINETAPAADLVVKQSGNTFTTQSQTVALFQRSSTAGHGAKIAIVAGTGGSSDINFGDTADEDIGIIQYYHTDNSFRFTTNTSERLRITSDGKLILSGTARTTPFIVGDGGMCIEQSYDGLLKALSLRNKDTDAAAATALSFSLNRSGGDEDYQAGEIKLVKEQAWTTTSSTVDGSMVFSTIENGSLGEKLRITSAGNVGIGENSPADRLVVQKANASADVGIRIKNDTTTDGDNTNPTTASLYLNTSTSDFNTFYIQARRNDNYTHFGYSDPRANGHIPYMVLTNSRQTLIGGATAPYSEYNGSNGGWNGGHYINLTSTQWGTLHIADWDSSATKNSYGGTNVFLSRCKNNSIGTHSGGALSNGEPIARLLFNGSDGSNFRTAAWIEAAVDAAASTGVMPGRIVFATSSASTAAPVERLRIDSGGKTLIYGSLGPGNLPLGGNAAAAGLQIRGTTKYQGIAFGQSASSATIGVDSTKLVYTANANPANLGGGVQTAHEWWSGSSGGGGPSKIAEMNTSGQLYLGGYPLTHTVAGGSNLKLRAGTGAWCISIGMRSSQNDYAYIGFTDMNGTEQIGDIFMQRTAASAGHMVFSTNDGSGGSNNRLRIASSGRVCVSPDSSFAGESTNIAMSIVASGGDIAGYPGLAIRSTDSGGGSNSKNGMSMVATDGNWDLYNRSQAADGASGNRHGLAILTGNSASSSEAAMYIRSDKKIVCGPQTYNGTQTTHHSHTGLHVAGGGLAVGSVSNGTAYEAGRYTLGWYHTTYAGNTSANLHLVTSLWGGGSPSGNTNYIMGGFILKGYYYGHGYSEERIFFHNWSGGLPGYTRVHNGSWNPGNSVYVNSSGYVTIKLVNANYIGYVIDLIQYPWYSAQDIRVTSTTFNSGSNL